MPLPKRIATMWAVSSHLCLMLEEVWAPALQHLPQRSSSQGGASSGGASTETTPTSGADAAVSGDLSVDASTEKCGQQLGMEDWEGVLPGSPSQEQEQSILRLIMSEQALTRWKWVSWYGVQCMFWYSRSRFRVWSWVVPTWWTSLTQQLLQSFLFSATMQELVQFWTRARTQIRFFLLQRGIIYCQVCFSINNHHLQLKLQGRSRRFSIRRW